jgi:hypothetical protein
MDGEGYWGGKGCLDEEGMFGRGVWVGKGFVHLDHSYVLWVQGKASYLACRWGIPKRNAGNER